MRYYSLADVLHDINEVEHFEVKMPDLEDLRFVKLYSDFYADKEKKGDFKQRFARYAIACRLIPLDKEISPDKKVTVYSYVAENGTPFEAVRQNLMTTKL